MIDYTLTRSKRKTIAIHIRDGGVEVRAPMGAPIRDIERFIISKEAWIADKLSESRRRMEHREGFCLDYGSLILYRGKRYPITAKENGQPVGFNGTHFVVQPGLTPERIMDACIQIYRSQARQIIKPKAYALAEQMAVSFVSIKITGAQQQWGSCSRRKRINISWRLMMADDDVIKYVLVHENAHLIEMNHSPRFWAIVEGVLPDYRERQKRLRELQKKLAEESWEEKPKGRKQSDEGSDRSGYTRHDRF